MQDDAPRVNVGQFSDADIQTQADQGTSTNDSKPDYTEKVRNLMEMGFEEKACLQALEIFNGDENQAVMSLLSA